MLPLQWSAAAVASLCLTGEGTDAQATVFAQAHASTQADKVDLAHGQAIAFASDHASHHHGAPDPGHDDGKAPHAGHGGCCHATGSALPTQPAMGRLQAEPADLVARMTVLAVSHPSESPFRPPRLALA